MTPHQFRTIIAKLGLSQERAGLFFGYSARQGRRWAAGEAPIPKAVEMLARLMVKSGLRPDDLE